LLGEVGPEPVDEHQLRISRLPKQEIADPLLPAGTDEQVRIGHAGGEKMRLEQLFIDRNRLDLASMYALGNPARRVSNFAAAAITQRNRKL
jgi:hypothetical protein